MNKGLWKFVTRVALLRASLIVAFTLLAGTASAHATNTIRPQGHYLGGDHMYRGGYFDFSDGGNDYLLSQNHRYQLIFQTDGNLVEYDLSAGHGGVAIWASDTVGTGANLAAFQSDGNFVIYAGKCAKWRTATNYGNDPGYELIIKNSGEIGIWDQYGNLLDYTPLFGYWVGC